MFSGHLAVWEPNGRSEIKIAKKIGGMTSGKVFVNVVSLKYIGMMYINVGEMCLIPMNVHY